MNFIVKPLIVLTLSFLPGWASEKEDALKNCLKQTEILRTALAESFLTHKKEFLKDGQYDIDKLKDNGFIEDIKSFEGFYADQNRNIWKENTCSFQGLCFYGGDLNCNTIPGSKGFDFTPYVTSTLLDMIPEGGFTKELFQNESKVNKLYFSETSKYPSSKLQLDIKSEFLGWIIELRRHFTERSKGMIDQKASINHKLLADVKFLFEEVKIGNWKSKETGTFITPDNLASFNENLLNLKTTLEQIKASSRY